MVLNFLLLHWVEGRLPFVKSFNFNFKHCINWSKRSMSIQFKYSCISKKVFILICAIFAWTWSVQSILDLWGTYLPYSSWFENQLKRIVYELLKWALNGNILTMVMLMNSCKDNFNSAWFRVLITVKNNDLIGATLKELKIVVMDRIYSNPKTR